MKVLPKVIFVVYLLILIKLILFKGPVFFEVVPTSDNYIEKRSHSSLVAVNLKPFKTISRFSKDDASTSGFFFNIIGNILLFIPYGVLLPLLFKRRIILFDVFYSAVLFSLSFELFQLITLTGQFDVDDIILNTTGGIAGYLLLMLSERIRERRQLRNRSKRKRER